MTSRPAFLADVEQSAWQARIRSLSMKFDYLKTMRDQAIFVAAFFSIFGLITTDMYYSTFGVKYQFLNLNATHMVYRGFTEIYFNPLFFGVFIIILVGVFTSQARFTVKVRRTEIDAQYFAYAVLGIALCVGVYLSITTGETSATRDIYADTTSLHRSKLFIARMKLDLKYLIR